MFVRRPAPGIQLARGVCRELVALGLSPLTEFPTKGGLRMDVCALAEDGDIWCVEVKSCRADFVSDRKWQGYLDWCDRLMFAVPEGFPDDLLPASAGLMRADAYGGEILRPPARTPLNAARRKAMTIRFARLATERLIRSDHEMQPFETRTEIGHI